MPDEEGEPDLEELVADALYVETLMGWDGSPCECRECDCHRFADGNAPAGDSRCLECRGGDHAEPAS